MIVKIVLFAMARELIGASEIEIEIESGSTVGRLRARLTEEYPKLAELVARSAISVDQEFSVEGQLVPENAEVALIPPVSGG